MSPMYALYLEYSSEEESEHSVSRRAALLAMTPHLDLEDVEEFTEGTNYHVSSYRIKESARRRIERVITELQVFIERMAALISERGKNQYFVVDPDELIQRTLSRSQSLEQLQAGWLMLSQRMGAAQKFIAKYIQQYQDCELPTSPVSTKPSLYEAIRAESSEDNQLKLTFATIPRHANRISEEDQLTLRKMGAWEDTSVVPRWLKSLPREGDENDREEAEKPLPAIRPQAPLRALSPILEGQSLGSRSRRSEEPEEIYTAGVKGKETKAGLWNNSGSKMEPIQSGPLMGGGTPFKPSRSFFDTERGSPMTPFPQRGRITADRRASATPNVLYGMAVPGPKQPEIWGSLSSVSQNFANRHKETSQPSFQQGSSRDSSTVWGFEPCQTEPPFPRSSYRNPGFTPTMDNVGPKLTSKEDSEEGSTKSHQKPETQETGTKEIYSGPPLTAAPGGEYYPDDDYSGTSSSGGGDDAEYPGRGPTGPPGRGNRPPGHRGQPPPAPPPPPGGRGGGGGGGGNPPNGGGGNPPNGGGGNPPIGGQPVGGPGGAAPIGGLNQQPVPYAYGNFVPTIKAELKQEQLPSWDGNHDTAIEYFWKVQQLAALGGYIPQALGYWLWHNLKEGSTIQLWFAMLAPGQQEYMRAHYLNYLRGIKDGYLGRVWQMKMNKQYESQSFRQPGHDYESPTKFIVRRIMFTRMLVQSDNRGPLEVFLVMQRAPISWGPVINIDSITNTSKLYAKVTEHERALVYSSRLEHSNLITTDNLVYTMKKLGLMVTPTVQQGRKDFNDRRPSRRANLGEIDLHPTEEIQEEGVSKDEMTDDDPTGALTLDIEESLKEAYEVMKGRPRPPPKDGYPYPKNDHVTTKMGKLPPSPCKVCGSSKHWDKECPDWNVYLESRKRSAKLVISNKDEDEIEHRYQFAYSVLMDNRIASEWRGKDEFPQDFHKAVSELIDEHMKSTSDERKTGVQARNISPRPVIEEEIDVEEHLNRTRHVAKADYILESMDIEKGAEPPPTEEPDKVVNPTSEGMTAFSTKRIKVPKGRLTRPGFASEGVSVLSIRGKLIHPSNPELDLRLDSGADVTLVSEDYLEGLNMKPRLLQGQKMKLWQLTDTDCEMKGYVRLPVLVEVAEGKCLEMEAEAYVVPRMTVPLLLGEDFQTCYEVNVERSVMKGTTISFGKTPFSIKATAVDKTKDFERLKKTAYKATAWDKAKAHRRNKKRKQRTRRQDERDHLILRAMTTVTIPPDTCRRVPVSNRTLEEKTYVLESVMITNRSDQSLLIPNILFNPSEPYLPVSNTSATPLIIHKGDILGQLHEAADFFDEPRDKKHRQDLETHARKVSAFISATMEVTSQPGGEEQADSTEPDELGPKSAELPDLTIYPSAKMQELLDIGDLPESLKPKAWEMLNRHVGAFGFDGRLGHYPSKVQIRTKEGLNPISLPMYGTSPAKRTIIDEQIDKWFELDVIEPSKSPWGAPVVIAYRNGKPRFCVDYRKLNAMTVPDEFPLPRQSEILASLAGAQVLLSLDALSGFTQLEMDPEHKEKTAFRTHRGLFQFKRMPFGLRNGPSIFQRITQGILSPYLWIFCLVYIDDIVVYSKSYEAHIDHLDKVLTLIEESGITLSPTKCHLFYGSILLLGHKVSRLGLSTHEEKVKAVLDLDRPTKVSELQTFLGMAVYFSAFIPYYADRCAPLFGLLRKGAKWVWEAEHERSWQSLKEALQSAPVLGHPMEGRPYRLYTDASDKALGCALQQIQPIKLGDLKGTKVYSLAQKAFERGEAPPKLTTNLSTKIGDDKQKQEWGDKFDDTIVQVERVIAYWSRTFKPAETRYSTTEREALGAKEGLIRFQPYIEGETILLVTDHAALQWARTYENANRRLAAWGAVFSAYSPGLEIVHRPGRVHSNVDPLSRLNRQTPRHTSPARDATTGIQIEPMEKPDETKYQPAKKFSLNVWAIQDGFGQYSAAYQLETRRQKRLREMEVETANNPLAGAEERKRDTTTGRSSKGVPRKSEGAKGRRSQMEESRESGNIHVRLDETLLSEWVEAYATSASMKDIWSDPRTTMENPQRSHHYFRDENDLLFFKDADGHPRLCVPEAFRKKLLELAHESAIESAHCGPEKLWQRLSPRFYWKRMKNDLIQFCATCDVCQKTKPSNFNKFGYLMPNAIPKTPYVSISMDFIVNLPMSGEFNAIFVIVDRLTKHANFIPTTTGLTAEDFAHLFVKFVISKYGIPESVICDRDPRWTSDFWKAVTKELKSKMLFSSSHHPQTDGQTEIVNKQLEKMLRAYVNGDKSDWPEWLHLLEFAYNSTVHSSMGQAPFELLLGFIPRTLSDFLPVPTTHSQGPKLKRATTEFVENLAMHRDLARQAIAEAQQAQATQYNKCRKDAPTFRNGDKVLVNPHSLEWVESKGEGAKLGPRWIGPFEVLEKINDNVYRLSLPDSYPGSSVMNIAHLKRYNEPQEGEARTKMATDLKRRDASEEYEVERILGHKYVGPDNKLKFLIRWKNYGPQFDLWEDAASLRNAPQILRDYKASAGL